MLNQSTLRHAALAVAVAAAVALTGCTDKKAGGTQAAAQQQRATPVSVQVISYSPIEMRTELSGRVTAFQTAEVRPQVSGILQSRLFEEGTEVKLGQQLYQIDPAVYEANLASAQASLLQAQASLASAKADARRSAELVKIKAVSASQNDQAQAAWKVAEANVAAARAAVKTAQINLQYTHVNSPIAGKVSLSEMTPGALVSANQAQRLTVVQQIDKVYVDVTQSYGALMKMRSDVASGALRSEGRNAPVHLILDNGQLFKGVGKLTFTDALVDEATGTVRVRAVFDNPDRVLMPGMFVRAQVVQGVRENGIRLDQRATLRRNNGTPYVYIVNKDNKIESRDIVIGAEDNGYWVVDSGLAPGEKVVIEGLQHVRVGALVDPTAPVISKVGPTPAAR